VAALGGHARLESAIVAALEHAHRASG
jgi:hypothetical protein